ncbi:hypothetical protein, partial [uncultured Allobaculum sp.]|uniref:hypothetical protein n=1 Tax=uncultured Allobaculum sp. TaxID=1187017 RepID=UPI002616B492
MYRFKRQRRGHPAENGLENLFEMRFGKAFLKNVSTGNGKIRNIIRFAKRLLTDRRDFRMARFAFLCRGSERSVQIRPSLRRRKTIHTGTFKRVFFALSAGTYNKRAVQCLKGARISLARISRHHAKNA